MKMIPLTQGKEAIVDDGDYESLISLGSWHFDRYAKRVPRKVGPVYMHRLVINAPPNKQVDHINGDKLDNRRVNLRLCTTRENTKAQHKSKGGTSRYKGVSWDKLRKKWTASIRSDYKKFQIGRYDSELEAARAYDARATALHKDFAVLNFPKEVVLDDAKQ